MGSKGINWVQRLPNYQRILNEDPKEVLAYKTPFEVYFAHKCNSYNTAMTDKEVVENARKCNPSEGDRRQRSKHASLPRKKAANASLKIKGSKLSETLHTCRVLRWSCCSQSLIIACEARTKDFHRPLKFCLSLSPSLLLLVVVNFPFFTFFLGPFDWIALFLDMIWKSSLPCTIQSSKLY